MQVFRITAEICRQVFPVTLDVDHPAFLAGLERLRGISDALGRERGKTGLATKAKRAGLSVAAGAAFLRLLLRPGRRAALPEQVRLSPAW
jgi:magnesium-protoporphyrin IX monomethyl ester (oxidative) cyclase